MSLSCPHCQSSITETDNFCGNCGKKITAKKQEKEKSSIQLIISFYVVYLLFAIVSYAIYAESYTLFTEIAVELVFILLTITFCLFDAKAVFSLYAFKKIDGKGLFFALFFPILSAGVVYYGIEFINQFIFEENDNIFYSYMDYSNPFFWAFVFYVIIPPIFEELAFRGFLYNQLRVVANPQVTILATAVIFALVHFSFISFLWIFPFGIVLGYLRHRYNTLWLGMIIHFIHNLLVVLLDYYYFDGGIGTLLE